MGLTKPKLTSELICEGEDVLRFLEEGGFVAFLTTPIKHAGCFKYFVQPETGCVVRYQEFTNGSPGFLHEMSLWPFFAPDPHPFWDQKEGL